MVALVTDAKKSALPSITEVGVAVFDASLTPTVDAGAVGSLTGEITVGDAPGYQRVTVDTAWDTDTRRLMIDDDWPIFDLEGAPSVAYVVTYDTSDGQVISFIPFVDLPGHDGWEAILEGGVAGWDDDWAIRDLLASHGDRITALESAGPGPGGGVESVTGSAVDNTDPANPVIDLPAGDLPDPSGEDDGDVLTVASGAAVWAPPPSGGGPSPPPTPEVWLSTGSLYADRGRVWFGGTPIVASGDSSAVPLDPLAAPMRPASNRLVAVHVVDDVGGSPSTVVATMLIESSGDLTLFGASAFTGDVQIFAEGASFRIEDPS